MPYDNLPESKWAEMDKCVSDVMAKGQDKQAAIAICYTSLTKAIDPSILILEQKAVTKSEADGPHPASDYLIVEDPTMPTTWHLRVKDHGKPDHGLMGAAWAALHEGYRGNKYEGPNKDKAIAELTKLYASEGQPLPGKAIDKDDMKAGARHNSEDQKHLNAAHDHLVAAGASCSHKSIDIVDIDFSNPVKAISETPEELRIGNYMILFGGRDLTGIVKKSNPNGTKGEYFSKNTDLESEYTKSGVLHVDFEHGQDPDGVGADDDAVLGYVDWKTAQVDEKGVFVQRVLNRRAKYVKWLEELIKAGLVGNSTMAITGKTKKSLDGEILKWPLKRDTLTVMPFEPRMLTQNAVEAIKSLAADFPAIKLLSVEPEAAEDRAAAKAVTKNNVILSEPSQENATMEITEDVLTKLVSDAAAKAILEYRKSEPAPKTPAVTIETDEAEQPWKSAGEFFQAVKNATLYPNSEDRRLRPLKAATGLNEGTPADGGYLVAPTISAGIVERMYTNGQLLSRITKDPIGPNSNGMIYNGIDETSRVDGSRYGGLQSYWLAEAGAKTGKKPQFRQVELKLKKIAALCYSTDELLQDAVALQSWLERTVPNELMFRVEDAIFEGDGVGKPLGMLAAPALVTVTRTTASQINITDITGMWGRRWAGVTDYVWLINQDVFPQLIGLSGTYQNVFLPQGSLAGVPYNTLLGKPIIEIEYAQSLNTKGDIMLAAMSQYQAIDKGGVESASSIHVNFTTDETAFRFVYRIDGAPLWYSALTPFHGSNTMSPFVVLGSASA